MVSIEATSSENNNIYSVIASEIIRPNSDYDVIFQTDNANETIRIQTTFETEPQNPSLNPLLDPLALDVVLEPNTHKRVTLKIPDLPADKYTLNVNVTVGKENSTKITKYLKYPTNNLQILLQTDKGLYKPGDELKFRLVALKNNNLPESNGIFSAYLIDTNQNRIKQWTNQSLDEYGHFQDKFQFSNNIDLGRYQLVVEIGEQKRKLSIELQEYVLPQFSVDITIPKSVSFEDSKLPVVVESKYTHGKNVRGTVNVTLRNTGCLADGCDYDMTTFWPELTPLDEVSVVMPINGRAETTFDTARQLKVNKLVRDSDLEVIATVTESVTGKNHSQTETFTLSAKSVNLEFTSDEENLKPGLKYTGYIQGQTHDKKPIDDSVNPVTIGYRFSKSESFKSFDLFLKNGIIPIALDVPENATTLHIRASYKNYRFNLKSAYPRIHDAINEVQILPFNTELMKNNKVRVIPSSDRPGGSIVRVSFQTLKQLQRYNWIVIVDSKILENKLVTKVDSTKQDLSFDLHPSMYNGFKLIIYFLPTNSSRWIFTETNYEASVAELTDVKLSSSMSSGRPGEKPLIKVTAPPKSFVAVLGVDQSTILLKKPNFIDENQLKSEKSNNANAYMTGLQYSNNNVPSFSTSKVLFFTNGQVMEYNYYPHHAIMYSAPRSGFAMRGAEVSLDAMPESYVLKSGKSFQDSLPGVKVRKEFPETWLWADAVTDPVTGEATFQPKFPDTITTWVLNAFGVSTEKGLSVARSPLELTVFNKFFIKADLPYSVVREEVVSIKVLVYNYLGKRKSVQVTLHNELNEFDFVKTPTDLGMADNELTDEENQNSQTANVQAESDDVASVTFLIRAKQVGNIKLQLVAKLEDGTAGDKVEQLLLVKPEGEIQRFNKALLLNMNASAAEQVNKIPITFPTEIVPGSRLITIDAIGDVLGVRLTNLDKLVRMPYGCGEQNMAGLVPNIVAYEYLTKTEQLSPRLKNSIIHHLEQGYARQLRYQHSDGGYSAFGYSEYSKHASTWLSAYVLSWFIPASKIISIEREVLEKTANFLTSVIDKDGHAIEHGSLYDKHMSGGLASNKANNHSPAMDAFVLLALNKAKSVGILNESNVTATVSAVESFVTGFKPADSNDKSRDNDYYTLALVAHALKEVNSPLADKAFDYLWSLHQTDKNEGLFFDKPKREKVENKELNRRIWYFSYLNEPRSNSIEASAYALNFLNARKDVTNQLKIVKWLISKQNSFGGWSSTQDTVVAINALANFATQTHNSNSDLKVTFSSIGASAEPEAAQTSAFKGQFDVNKNNLLVLQKSEFAERGFEKEYSNLDSMIVKSNGFGTAVVQVSWQYNVVKVDDNKIFNVTHEVSEVAPTKFDLKVCASYQLEGETNMAIVSVETPSGFEFESGSINALRQTDPIRRIDVNGQNNQASFYFDKIDQTEVCFTVSLDRINCVNNLKPALINVYDYYETTKATRHFYEIPNKSVCLF